MSTKLILVSALFSLFNLVSAKCNTDPCAKDAMKHQGDYVACDMCVCDVACNLNRDDEIYQCYIQVIDLILVSYLIPS
jgi:hypothetical protein